MGQPHSSDPCSVLKMATAIQVTAVAALDLLQTADLHRLKTCPPEHGGCGWVFLDTSKNGSRRWCSMDDCGTHAKSRRLAQRRRDSRSKA